MWDDLDVKEWFLETLFISLLDQPKVDVVQFSPQESSCLAFQCQLLRLKIT
jgi:hypothetical protein